MIFQTVKDDFPYQQSRYDYIEVKMRIPRHALEKVIQDVLRRS